MITGYAGTYATPESVGIYRFTFDTDSGVLTTPVLYCHAPDAKYVSLRDGMLAAPIQRDGKAGVLLADTIGGIVAETLNETVTACHVAQDERRVYTANFHEGTVCAFDKPDLTLAASTFVAPKAGCHQVLLHGGMLLAPCLELDRIALFDAETLESVGEIAFPKGSGPRHGVFDKAHTRLFVAGQRSHSVFVFQVGKAFTPVGEFAILERGQIQPSDETAAIRLSPDERFLYVSVRGSDCIAAFRVEGCRLELIQKTSSGGKHPRDFILSPDGRFLLAANRFGGGIACFARDAASGLIGELRSQVELPQVVSLTF